jgi:hypothetical protein
MSRKFRSGAGSRAREETHSPGTTSNNRSYDTIRSIAALLGTRRKDSISYLYISKLETGPTIAYNVNTRKSNRTNMERRCSAVPCCVDACLDTQRCWTSHSTIAPRSANAPSGSFLHAIGLCYRAKGEAILVCVDPKLRRNVIACRVEPMHYVIAN